MSGTTTFRIGQRVRIISLDDIVSLNDSTRRENDLTTNTGTIASTLTVSPGYYTVRLDITDTRCIVFETNLEALREAS